MCWLKGRLPIHCPRTRLSRSFAWHWKRLSLCSVSFAGWIVFCAMHKMKKKKKCSCEALTAPLKHTGTRRKVTYPCPYPGEGFAALGYLWPCLSRNNHVHSLPLLNTTGSIDHNLQPALHMLGLYYLPLHAKIIYSDLSGKCTEERWFKLRYRQVMQMNTVLHSSVSFKNSLL